MSKAERSQSQQLKSCILILGMHRSGTSALAGVLNKLGCDLPATPMPASKSNERGFFESNAIKELNEDLLASAGSFWDDFTPFHTGWLQSPHAETFLDRAVSTLGDEFGDSPLFVLKDPRICRVVPFWIEALKRFDCAVRPLLTIRNPLDIGQSLLSKKGISDPVGQMLWLRHALDAEHDTRGMARFNTSFEQLMQGWELVARKAEENLKVVWPKNVSSAEFEVAKFLSADLQHHRDSPARTMTNELLPEWLRETYGILDRWAQVGELSDDHPKLDRIKAEFDCASTAFSRLVQAERQISTEQRQRSEELKQATKTLQAEVDQLAAADKLLKAETDASKSERDALAKSLEQERAAREAEAIALKSMQDRRDRDLALLEEQGRAAREAEAIALKSMQDQRDSDLALLEEQRAAAATLEAQLATAEGRQAALEQQLEARTAEFEQRRAALEDREKVSEARLAELEFELADIRAASEEETAALKSALEEQRRRATLMDAELYQLKEERETLESQLADLRSEVAEHRARRKEASRVIARRDAEIQARFQELAILERQILRSSLSWRAKDFWSRLTGAARVEHRRAISS